ncbi:PAS domain S-box protein [Mucilaginibacter sp. BJC16-A38]|uniref:PAS domain S-box protein n=1 Tax=Mucilaginibacter phenanthrenivorans TaxID=1234842 RepID=UPI002157F755|nr:PAS domain S-box protein [Mucilaginibacter phenanthrenivorans]MCR8557855.1 PAS domain S-box protein [Mucilaginibacter phenanthrenivorans]
MPDLLLNELGFLFDDNPNPMWVFEIASLRILKVNKAAIINYGYTETEFLELTISDLRDESNLEAFYSYLTDIGITESNKRGISSAGVWKHKGKHGDLIYTEITSHDVKYRNLDCRIVAAADISEKLQYRDQAKQREQELVWTKNSLEALINNTEDEIWSVDKETRYMYMNQAYRNRVAYLTGTEPKEGDYSYLHSYTPEIIEAWKGYYGRTLAGERYAIVNESITPDTKEVLSFEINFNPIYNNEGEITGVGCFARNITQRLKTEQAIIDQNNRLRHIASLTSHELRRPVASMLGLIAIMDRANFYNPDNQEIIEHLLTVGNEIDEVIRLIVDKTFTDEDRRPDKFQTP